MNSNIFFLSDSIDDSTVVQNGATKAIVYAFSTEGNITDLIDAHGKVVGKYRQRWILSDRVTVREEQKKIGQFLPGSSWFPRFGNRRVTAPGGKVYIWKCRKRTDSLKLVDSDTGQTVAKAHNAKKGKRKMNIDYKPELEPIIDVLILSFIICERWNRELSWDNLIDLAHNILSLFFPIP